jgi:AcrR family transcriptional regulator
MSPRTPQQFENIREVKKTLIMDSALELIAENGYQDVSISNIARRAGISKGLMYNYFESKDELIRSIVIRGLDKIGEMIDPNHDGVITKEEMKEFIELMFDQMKADMRFWALYMSLLTQPRVIELVAYKLNEILGVYLKMLTSYFTSLGHEDPETDSLIFGALLDGIGLHFVSNQGNFPIEKVKQRLIQLFCS